MHLNCKSEAIKTLIIKSPLGDFSLESCLAGVHRLMLVRCRVSGDGRLESDEKIAVRAECADKNCLSDVEISCIGWLRSYFEKSFKSINYSPPICHLNLENGEDASSTTKIWQALRTEVLPGKTTSYSELAVRSGLTPKHCRLVGRAMSSNPTILLVPCHRVLPKSRDPIGRFSADGGRAVKEWLLRHESAFD